MKNNLNRQAKYYLLILGIISTLLVIHTINFRLNNFGVFDDDIYFYLINSLQFAGANLQDSARVIYGPLICFLTSLLIRAGVEGVLSIYIVTGIIAILGNLGLYLLLRIRFRDLLAFTGVIIYSGLSLYCMWLACGNLDIPAISMTIWCIYFIILAINRDPKYYIHASIFLILGVLIRYTVVLIIPLILMYFIYKTDFKLIDEKTKKYLKFSLISIAIISVISFVILFFLDKTNMDFLNQIYVTLTGGSFINDYYYNPSRSFYITNTLEYISSYTAIFHYGENYHLVNPTPLSYFLIIIFGIGIILCYDKIKQLKILNKKIAILTILFGIITIGCVLIRQSIISIILLLVTIILAQKTLKDSGFENLDLNLLMLGWLLINLIFFALYDVKVNRYILTVAPPFIYFIICAVNKIEVKVENKVKIKNILPILLIILFLINGFSYITTIDNELLFHAEEEACQFLMEYDTNLSNATIASPYTRANTFYLQHNVITMDAGEVDSSGVTYYISYGDTNPPLNNYDLIYYKKDSHHNIHIYQKKS